jgi:hypothetical protein
MRDELEAPFLDEWLQDTEVTPPDPHQGARRVASRLPHAKQVGRWLPFVVFQRKAQTPMATDTAEYQPSPIPATNGHSPTVLGRTKFMFSPVKAITAGAIVFAIGGALLIAQPFDQQGEGVPGAETDVEAMRPALVTGTMVHQYPSGTDETTVPEGLTRRTHSTGGTGRVEASDSRLTGDVTFDYTLDFIPDPIVPDVEGLSAGDVAGFA